MRKYQINIDPEQVNEKPGKTTLYLLLLVIELRGIEKIFL